MAEPEKRECRNCKTDFIIEPEDFDFYKKIDVPSPTFCPECRMQRRMMWRNELMLHKRKSSLSGREIISQYSEDVSFPVYSAQEYFSRDWTPPEMEYDSKRGFFDQFKELLEKTPRCALLTDLQSLENGSLYQNASSRNKNCYMVSAAGDNKDCMYSNNLDYSENSIDCLWCRRINSCYECIDAFDSNKVFFSEECRQCVDCWFLYNCKNCTDCFGCVGLRNKSHCLWNEQLSKEEYKEETDKIFTSLTPKKIFEIRKKIEKLSLEFPRKYAHVDPQSSGTCTGDYIINSKNILQGFNVHESQNARYCSKLILGKECWDMTDWGDPAELCYEDITVGKNSYKVLFSNDCWPKCREIQYCDTCSNSHNLFGCVGLKNASFRILNKQYEEKEYHALVSEIIKNMKARGEYGEFFPKELSPFPYNESIAQEYFPITKIQAETGGLEWSVSEKRDYAITKKQNDLPKTITEIDAKTISNEVIECAHAGTCAHGCSTAFKITDGEFAFYKRFGLPLPQLCFNCRHGERFAKRNPLKLWHRQCMKEGCTNEFETSYAPDRKETIYCESCYQKEVV